MKKRSFFILVAIIAIATLFVTGCPTEVDEDDSTNIPEVLFYSGFNFTKSNALITDGKVTQTESDGSITITVKNEDYIDSGIVIEVGKLKDLNKITVIGTGEFNINLYFDIDGDGKFFNFEGNNYTDVGGDAYALGEEVLDEGTMIITGDSYFWLVNDLSEKDEILAPNSHKVSTFKEKLDDDMLVAIWVGVTSGDGAEKSITIDSVVIE